VREKTTTVIFVLMLALFFALALIIPKDERASVMENRPLASFPTLTAESLRSGKFQSSIETYLSDNIGLRSRFITAGTLLERAKGLSLSSGDMPDDRVITQPWGSQLVLSQGRIMEVYKKMPEVTEQYISVLNSYSAEFGAEHNMYLMLAPTQLEFDLSPYRNLADSQLETINYVYSSLNGFNTVNVYDSLAEHRNEYIYFRTDHHWTQRGAYYAYCALCKAQGVTPASLDDMTVHTYSGFLGYLFNQANVKEYAQFADDIEHFDFGKNYAITIKEKNANGKTVSYLSSMYRFPENSTANYGIFMGGDFSYIEIDTDAGNGRTALIIKDSYANALIPLLTANYQKLIILDPRSYWGTVGEITAKNDIDDIIFVNYALITSNADFVGYIDKIMK